MHVEILSYNSIFFCLIHTILFDFNYEVTLQNDTDQDIILSDYNVMVTDFNPKLDSVPANQTATIGINYVSINCIITYSCVDISVMIVAQGHNYNSYGE